MSTNKRKAKKTTILELKKILRERFLTNHPDYVVNEQSDYDDFYVEVLLESEPKLEKDLSKIEFSFENTFVDEKLDGFHTIDDFSYLAVTTGGDWEEPIFFIVYLDPDNNVRAYIPKDGNCYNKKTKEAFGNDEEADEEYAQKLGFEDFEDFINEFEFDRLALEKDFMSRIQVV